MGMTWPCMAYEPAGVGWLVGWLMMMQMGVWSRSDNNKKIEINGINYLFHQIFSSHARISCDLTALITYSSRDSIYVTTKIYFSLS